jgi:predicted  nucleic acid-binding Zn-ribbon protein
MNLEYIYCGGCGYEASNVYAAYSRQTANGDWYFCPHCGKETINIEENE